MKDPADGLAGGGDSGGRGGLVKKNEPPAGRFQHVVFQGHAVPGISRAVAQRTRESEREATGEPRRIARPEPTGPEARLVRKIISGAGLGTGEYRMEPLLRRIPACLRALRVASVQEAAALLEADPGLLPPALEALLIGTTEFFRDRPVFEALEGLLIPSLLRGRPHPRVWSAACSEGAELYSVAMIFACYGAAGRTSFLGSDCRPAVLEKARRGIYPALAAEGLPAPYRGMFAPAGRGGLQIAPDLRRLIRWEAGDVLQDTAAGTWDMILCRNLAIYLRPESSERLWTKLAGALAPGGLLVVGKAEKPRLPVLKRVGPCIYRKVCPSDTPE